MHQRRNFFGNVIVLGNERVGKTAMLKRITINSFNDQYKPTIGADFYPKKYQMNEKTFNVHYWDTAGQRYNTFPSSFYRGSDIFVIIFDVTDLQSFENIQYWRNIIIQNVGETKFFILAANKIDRSNERIISYDKGKGIADLYGMIYLEISCLSLKGLENLERVLLEKIEDDIKTIPFTWN